MRCYRSPLPTDLVQERACTVTSDAAPQPAGSGVRVWVEAARPRPLPAAIVPVLVGPAAATTFVAWRFGAALVVALALQVGVNYANDYFDGVRGVDTGQRVGPRRAVASGLVTAERMRAAMVSAFAVAAVAGVALAAATTWWLVPIGAVCVLAAVGYSGGPRPYASAGLGELSVFVFFGVVATVGSQFVHDVAVAPVAVVASLPVGLLAVAILVVNNLRDVPTDRAAGKTTLAVRLGEEGTRHLYAGLLGGAAVGVALVAAAAASLWPLLALSAAPFAWTAVGQVRAAPEPTALIPALGATARLHLAVGILLATGLAIT
jgi:1,4-dihydroxy-2-naphthoate polyprenyltransferase